MDTLKAMRVFAAVADSQGFAPAARSLDMSTSAVSRYVIELESWLGAQLLHRTTRRLSITEAGAQYLEQCRQIVADVDQLRDDAQTHSADPSGTLRITTPVAIGQRYLQAVLPEYLATYTNVSVDITTTDRFVDLVAEGFDIALRAGQLSDSTLIARRLVDVNLAVVASPGYLSTHGTPTSASDLKRHNCLIDTVTNYGDRWPVGTHSNSRTRVSGNLRINSGEIVRSLATSGVGIALLPGFMVSDEIVSGELISVLESEIHFEAGLYAVYPNRTHVSANIRSFIDHLVDRPFEH